MKISNKASAIKLLRLTTAHTTLLEKLLSKSNIVPGAYRKVFVKCGRENCWCKEGQGHPFRRITWSENGKSKTKSIPLEDVGWIIKVTENYRSFRKMRRELSLLETKIKFELDIWERKQIKATRKKRNILKTCSQIEKNVPEK